MHTFDLFLYRIKDNPYAGPGDFHSTTTGTKTRNENMRGNTRINSDSFAHENCGKLLQQ